MRTAITDASAVACPQLYSSPLNTGTLGYTCAGQTERPGKLNVVDPKTYEGLLKQAEELEDVKSLRDFLYGLRDAYGLQFITLTLTGIGFSDVIAIFGTVHQGTLDAYMENNPHRISPMFRQVKQGFPVLWSSVEPQNEIEAYYMKRFTEMLGEQGVAIPLWSADENTSVMMVAAERDDPDWHKRLPSVLSEMKALGLVLHRKLLLFQGLNPPSVELSKRHLDVLQMLATGMNEEQIARFLGIGEKSVKLYISQAKIRLRARSKVHAVATAISLGLLKTF